MTQSRHMSLVEAATNVFAGYAIMVTAQTVIFPLFGIHIPFSTNLKIGGCFMAVSLCRSYLIRRIFNAV